MKKSEGCNKVDCKYRSINRGSFVSCDYILIEKHVGGCPIGDECNKYFPGPKEVKNWQDTLPLVIPHINKNNY